MKTFKQALLGLLLTSQAFAGLPPTTVKGQSDTAPAVTFNVQVPKKQATRINGTTALLETGNDNLLENPGAEGSTLAATAYADAAGVQPVDGTGGSPTLTITRTTSSPLAGSGSYLITKDAANRQGEGVSWPFTIDRNMLGSTIQVSFDYETASGTYDVGSDSTDPDLTAWVYGPTDGTPTLTQLAPYKVLGCATGVICHFQANMQTAASGVAYRLILHETKTGTSAYTFKLDGLAVSSVKKASGTPVTDWVSFTMALTGSTSGTVTKGTATRDEARWRRVGDSMEIEWNYSQSAAGSGGVGSLLMTIPGGYSLDTTKRNASTVGLGNAGICAWNNGGGVTDTGLVGEAHVWDSTRLACNWDQGTGVRQTMGVGAIQSTTFFITMRAVVPIAGWSSNVVMSNDTDTRIVAAQANGSASGGGSAGAIVLLGNSKVFDTHNAYDTSTGRYTAPVSGYYRVTAFINASNNGGINIYVDAVQGIQIFNTNIGPGIGYGSGVVKVNAGQIIDLRTTANLGGLGGGCNITFERISGPAQIAASDSVSARYSGTSTSISSTFATITFSTKSWDTHNAYSGGTYTCPVNGKYSFHASVYLNGGNALGTVSEIQLRKAGSAYSVFSYYAPANINVPLTLNDTVDCLAGQALDIQVKTAATAPSISNSTTTAFFSIEKVGN